MEQDIRTIELFEVLIEEHDKVCKSGDYFMEKYFWRKVKQEKAIKLLFRVLAAKCTTCGDKKALKIIHKELADIEIEPLEGNILDEIGLALDMYK